MAKIKAGWRIEENLLTELKRLAEKRTKELFGKKVTVTDLLEEAIVDILNKYKVKK